MKRNRFSILCALALICASMPIAAAGPSGAGAQGPAPRGKMGLMFNAKNLLAIDGYEDWYQAGVGFKYWLQPAWALRGLLGIEHNTNSSGTLSTTMLGISAAGEWHPIQGDVSPYLGPFAGVRGLAETDQTTAVDIYFGGLVGVEAKVLGPLSAFAEYALLASFDLNGFSLNFGTDGSGGGAATIGLVVYF